MAYTVQEKDYDTIDEFIQDYTLEIFQIIYKDSKVIYKHNKEITNDNQMYEMAWVVRDFDEIAEEFASTITDKEKHVSEYGMYDAIQLYNEIDDIGELAGIHEEEFYGKLLYIILVHSKKSLTASSYEKYVEFCKNR
jgi:hypothetical protein